MKVCIIGLGLIGGSFAKAIKKCTDDYVVGIDNDSRVTASALDSGAADEISAQIPRDADMVLIALYPKTAVDFISSHLDEFPQGCMVIDLCGVKRYVCDQARKMFVDRDVLFIGGHPMAGREFTGFEAALPDLFVGASMILTPEPTVSRSHLLLAELFFKRLGFTAITYSTPERHDEIIALTSQLAHIVSSAYVQNPAAGQFEGFSAGSFQDMTRVAKLNETMWKELFLLNPDFLTEQLGQLIDKLQQFKGSIESGNAAKLESLLRTGREIKVRISKL